jgi:hypothetical protein
MIRKIAVRFLAEARNFIALQKTDRLCSPPSLILKTTRGAFVREKRPEREAKHSPTHYAKVKHALPYSFTAVDRNNFLHISPIVITLV